MVKQKQCGMNINISALWAKGEGITLEFEAAKKHL